MKILHATKFDIKGGASRAAYRIHRSLLKADIFSRMTAGLKDSDDWTVDAKPRTYGELRHILGKTLSLMVRGLYKSENSLVCSYNMLPSRLDRRINTSIFDIVNLHWVGSDFMSVEAIGRIKKPVVWTIHDMWAFCGAENYTMDDHSARFRHGYWNRNRPSDESGIDVNRWVWNRKRKSWQKPMTVVAPSQWLANCARESQLMRDWRIEVIPYPIDLNAWRGLSKEQARELLGLPKNAKIVLFGAVGGEKDKRKGFDLLLKSIHLLKEKTAAPIMLCVAGQSEPLYPPDLAFPVKWLGYLHDDISLNIAYSASDAVVIPSRQDNLPNVGIEALASGTPVAAFETGGLPDIVTHQKTGWLAKAFDPEHLAIGVAWMIENEARHEALCSAARKYAEDTFSESNIAKKYIDLYTSILDDSRH